MNKQTEEELNELFDKVHDAGALIYKGSGQFEIDRCQADLTEFEIPLLPDDYIDFLKTANGFAWNGFEFFGTYQLTNNKTGYMLQDIWSYNTELRKRRGNIGNRIILGRFDEDLYCYNYDKNVYESVDYGTFIQVDEYEDFFEMFICNVSEYIVWDDDDDDEEEDDDEE